MEKESAKQTFWRSSDLLEKDQAKNSILHTAAVGGAIRVTDLFLVPESKTGDGFGDDCQKQSVAIMAQTFSTSIVIKYVQSQFVY